MMWYKISVISVNDKIICDKVTGISIVFLLSTFVREKNVAFKIEVSENNDVIFFPFKFMDSLNSIHGSKG